MRSDWWTSVFHWDNFVNSPCMIIDDDSLSLVTCRSHSYGLQRRLIHMASSSTGNLVHLQSDRLAPLAVHHNEKIFCSRYLNKYAAGKEQHAKSVVTPGQSENT